MRNTIFPFFRPWLQFCLGLIVLLTTQSLGAGVDVTKDIYLTVRLMKQQGYLAFEMSVNNKTSTELRLGFGDCPLTYVVRVGNKNYIYPEKQPFVSAKTCTLSFREPKVPPKASIIVFTAQVRDDLEIALIKAKGNYSGEFRFELSTTTSKGIFQLVYKRQQR